MSQVGNMNRWSRASCHASGPLPTSECIQAGGALRARHPRSLEPASSTTERFVLPLHDRKCAPKEAALECEPGQAASQT